MSKIIKKYFDEQFKKTKNKKQTNQFHQLAYYKSTKPPEFYDSIIQSFKVNVSNSAKCSLNAGLPNFYDLLSHGVGDTTSIENEFKFAQCWLSGNAEIINKFRMFTNEIQDEILKSNFELAHTLIIDFRSTYGWSLWCFELEIALKTKIQPWNETRQFITSLIDAAPNKLSSLIAQIIRDRNDEAISVDSFFLKCKESFPKIGTEEKLQSYLLYRSTSTLLNPEKIFPIILSYDINNSIIDFYETLIDQFSHIAISSGRENLKLIIKDITDSFFKEGFEDYRIRKINFLVNGDLNPNCTNFPVSNELNTLIELLRSNNLSLSCKSESILHNELSEKIASVVMDGSSNQENITSLIKFGINFRGLPIGSAIGNFAATACNDISNESIYSPWIQFAIPTINIEDLLTIDSSNHIELIKNLTSFNLEFDTQVVANNLIVGSESNFNNWNQFHQPIITIWICAYLINNNAPENAIEISKELEKLGKPWDRIARKLLIWAYVKNNEIEVALKLSLSGLIDGIPPSELPLNNLIEDNKWSAFKDIDPISVAFVSHATYSSTHNTNARYICRMACRSFITSNQRNEIEKIWQKKSELERKVLINFLKYVWIDENLNMAGFMSTQEVRLERIQVLQQLMQIDTGEKTEYAEEIKSLTFNETLWKGLRHINETRIFVNESAITKWAEKEILSEFERWKILNKNENNNNPVLDNAINQYLTNMDLAALKEQLKKENLTESDAILIGLIDKLLKRFLSDPADGLDCYLSSRIRHGSLKGTLLGPLEEAGIIGSTDLDLEIIIKKNIANADWEDVVFIKSKIYKLNNNISQEIKHLLKDVVQIKSTDHPNGFIYVAMNPQFLAEAFIDLASKLSFQHFISGCYAIFWQLLHTPLSSLSNYLRNDVKNNIQKTFDELLESISHVPNSTTLLSVIRSIATKTQSQCEVVANWFESEKSIEQQIFTLKEAIEIAKASTQNIYRLFPTNIVNTNLPEDDIPLTAYGLSAITDCLYVMFENAWKHSGLGTEISYLNIKAELSNKTNILEISVSNPLHETRFESLQNGELAQINFNLATSYLDKVPIEGGSGIPKLARLVRHVDTSLFPEPLKIEINVNKEWIVKICIPLYKRGEAFDAYFY